eukprot:gene18344-8791_t
MGNGSRLGNLNVYEDTLKNVLTKGHYSPQGVYTLLPNVPKVDVFKSDFSAWLDGHEEVVNRVRLAHSHTEAADLGLLHDNLRHTCGAAFVLGMDGVNAEDEETRIYLICPKCKSAHKKHMSKKRAAAGDDDVQKPLPLWQCRSVLTATGVPTGMRERLLEVGQMTANRIDAILTTLIVEDMERTQVREMKEAIGGEWVVVEVDGTNVKKYGIGGGQLVRRRLVYLGSRQQKKVALVFAENETVTVGKKNRASPESKEDVEGPMRYFIRPSDSRLKPTIVSTDGAGVYPHVVKRLFDGFALHVWVNHGGADSGWAKIRTVIAIESAVQVVEPIDTYNDSDDEDGENWTVPPGTHGIVQYIDAAGDAKIVFAGENTHCWVQSTSFGRFAPAVVWEGAAVKARVDLPSCTAGPTQAAVRKGWEGTVVEVDQDGDALIDFEQCKDEQWVRMSEYGKLDP